MTKSTKRKLPACDDVIAQVQALTKDSEKIFNDFKKNERPIDENKLCEIEASCNSLIPEISEQLLDENNNPVLADAHYNFGYHFMECVDYYQNLGCLENAFQHAEKAIKHIEKAFSLYKTRGATNAPTQLCGRTCKTDITQTRATLNEIKKILQKLKKERAALLNQSNIQEEVQIINGKLSEDIHTKERVSLTANTLSLFAEPCSSIVSNSVPWREVPQRTCTNESDASMLSADGAIGAKILEQINSNKTDPLLTLSIFGDPSSLIALGEGGEEVSALMALHKT